MTRGLTLSVALHLAMILLAIVGLPQLFKPKPIEDRLMVVDVVTVGAVTNAPPPAESVKKPKAPTETSRAKPDAPRTPPPPPAASAPPPPPPTPKIEPPKLEAPAAQVAKSEPPKPQTAKPAPAAAATPKAEPAPVPAPKTPTAEPVPAPKPEAVAKAEPVPLPKPKPQEAKPPQPDAEAIPLPKPKPQESKKPEPEAPKPVEAQKPVPPKPEAPKPETPKAETPKPETPKAEKAETPPAEAPAAKPEAETVKAADATPEPPPPLPVSRPTPPKRPAKEQVAKNDTPDKDKKPDKNDDFLNVLKTVQKMKEHAAQPAESVQNAPKTSDSTARVSNFDANRPLSVSEIDAVRQQFKRCWLVPAGAKAGESLLVEIRVRMNPDRTVRDAEVVDAARMRTDTFFRAAAESALRALRNPSCNPLNLPPEKYETWKSFTITFDPKDMLS